MIALAIVVGVLPQYTDCLAAGGVITLPNGMTIPMKCHWSAQAELGLAVPLLAVGVLMVIRRRSGDPAALALLSGILGVVIALIPTFLIGVCRNPEMRCNMIMRPSLIFAGILVIIVSAGYWIVSRMRRLQSPSAERTSL
jgi:hypothetical protein